MITEYGVQRDTKFVPACHSSSAAPHVRESACVTTAQSFYAGESTCVTASYMMSGGVVVLASVLKSALASQSRASRALNGFFIVR